MTAIRRRMRFTQRTGLLLITALCIGLGIVVERARRQRNAVEALLEVWAEIQYDCDSGPRQTTLERYQLIGVNCLHSVVWLHLAGPEVTDETMAHLEALPHLRLLIISEGADVSNEGLKHLRAVPRLKRLDLASGSIDDRGLTYVAALSELEELSIQQQMQITDAGIQRLAVLKKLRRLTLWNTAVTEQGVAQLQHSLPHCEIECLTSVE